MWMTSVTVVWYENHYSPENQCFIFSATLDGHLCSLWCRRTSSWQEEQRLGTTFVYVWTRTNWWGRSPVCQRHPYLCPTTCVCSANTSSSWVSWAAAINRAWSLTSIGGRENYSHVCHLSLQGFRKSGSKPAFHFLSSLEQSVEYWFLLQPVKGKMLPVIYNHAFNTITFTLWGHRWKCVSGSKQMLLSYSEGDAFSLGLCVEYTSHHLSDQCSRVERLLPLFRVFVLLRSVCWLRWLCSMFAKQRVTCFWASNTNDPQI